MSADTLLLNQLADAEKANQKLQAWFRLNAVAVSQNEPEKITQIAKAIIFRAKFETGEDPENFNIQPLLGTFTVYARPAFIRALMKQPEISQAGAAHVPGFGLIRPVKSKPVRIKPSPIRKKPPAR